MLKQETKEIGGKRYTTRQFPAMRAFPLFMRLVKHLGPAMSALGEANPQSDLAELVPTIAVALRDLDPAAVTELARDILADTSVALEGGASMRLDSDESINAAFMGDLMLMFKVLAHAARVNFADFFGGSAGAGGPLIPSAPTTPKG